MQNAVGCFDVCSVQYDMFVIIKPKLFTYKVYILIQSRLQHVSAGWTVRGSNPGGGEIFRNCPDRPWGLPSLLYNEYRVSLPGVKRPGRGVDHPPPSSTEVKERVELYLYSPSGPSWPVLGRTLPLQSNSMNNYDLLS